jgi:NAD(P)-dependent dehydrogenase (short-subunit alcohol dehydrogenase family)
MTMGQGITSMPYDQQSTTDEVIAGIDLHGKTAVVTGASAGLGIETVRALAGAGARVVMVARDPARLETATNAVRQQQPHAALETRQMDLADLASVRAAADDLRRRFPAIHLLINNAGVMACPFERTRDGFELQFGTNHLGHFLFSCLLAPALLAAAPARVVTLSSAGHKFGGIDFEDPNYRHRDYKKWQAYGQSKTANALFSVALNERLSGRGVTANAVHPGMIVTELGRHLDRSDIEILQSRAGEQQQQFKSIPAGAATSVWAATSPDLDGRGGLYLEDCQVGQPEQGGSSGYAEYALDTQAAEALWLLSEQLVGESFDFAS